MSPTTLFLLMNKMAGMIWLESAHLRVDLINVSVLSDKLWKSGGEASRKTAKEKFGHLIRDAIIMGSK